MLDGICPFSFQLTPSQRATDEVALMPESFVFQLTPSQRATPFDIRHVALLPISTHALTEGDGVHNSFSCFFDISTHALTEGDLKMLYRKFYHIFISTHALTEGDQTGTVW